MRIYRGHNLYVTLDLGLTRVSPQWGIQCYCWGLSWPGTKYSLPWKLFHQLPAMQDFSVVSEMVSGQQILRHTFSFPLAAAIDNESLLFSTVPKVLPKTVL